MTVSIADGKGFRKILWLVRDQTMMEENSNRCVSPAKPASFSLDPITRTLLGTGAKVFFFPLVKHFRKSQKTF